MRSNFQKLCDTWGDLGVQNQFGLAFIGSVFLLFSALEALA